VAAEDLGITVPSGDVEALEAALFRLLEDAGFAAGCRARIAAVAPRFAWPAAVAPLLAFCREPRRAADLVDANGPAPGGDQLPAPLPPPATTMRDDLALLLGYWRRGGLREVLRRAAGRLARRARSAGSS
jgi:hypothetical protein